MRDAVEVRGRLVWVLLIDGLGVLSLAEHVLIMSAGNGLLHLELIHSGRVLGLLVWVLLLRAEEGYGWVWILGVLKDGEVLLRLEVLMLLGLCLLLLWEHVVVAAHVAHGEEALWEVGHVGLPEHVCRGGVHLSVGVD